MIIQKNWVINLSLSTAIVVTCLIGDKRLHSIKQTPLIRAVADNMTHGLIGLFTSAIVFIESWDKIYFAVICMILSSAIDVDHFIAAKSLRLSDATSLQSRPFLHNSSIPLFFILLLLYFQFFSQNEYVIIILTVIIIAFTTHHIRDGNRRGLWFGPFFQTPPIPYLLYIVLTLMIPFLFKYFIINDLSIKYTRLNASQLIFDV